MKIYLVYAKIPHYLKNYAFDFIDNFTSYVKDGNGNYVGLYAWTTKKKYFKAFKETRSKDFFVYKEKNIPSGDIEYFRKELSSLELIKHSFAIVIGGKGIEYKDKKSGKGIKMILVYDEYDKIVTSHDGNVPLSWYNMTTVASEDYYPLNDTIIDALDIIGYTSEYDMLYGGDDDAFLDEEIDSRRDTVYNQLSYQLTVDDNSYINLMANEFNTFMFLYEPLVFGKESTITKKYKRGELQ